MKLTVKNIRSCQGMEGEAYSCTLYVDGKRAATAQNAGDGGETRIHFTDPKVRDAVYAYAKQHEDYEYMGDSEAWSVQTTLEMLIAKLVDDKAVEKQLKGWCRTQTLFRTDDMPEGEYRTIRAKYSPSVAAHINRVAPGATIVNEQFVN